MQDGTIGRRYARALAVSLDEAKQGDALSQVESQLSALGAMLEKNGHADLREAMFNPSFSVQERKTVLADIAESNGFHPVAARMLELLVDKERIQYLPAIAHAFRDEVDSRVGQVRAHVKSASALSDDALNKLVQQLEKRTGKKVLPQVEVDPAVISGVSARIGGQVFDNTVSGQLDRIRSSLGVA